MEKIGSNKKKFFIDFITNASNSQMMVTTHREIAAWTITAFYLTGLIAVSKYLHKFIYDISSSNLAFWLQLILVLIVIFAIILLFIAVFVFVHSQYGSHVSNRESYKIYEKKVFQLINDDISLTKNNCKVKDQKSCPQFLQKEIEKKKDMHKWNKIHPLRIYIWLWKSTVSFLSCKSKTSEKSEDNSVDYTKLELSVDYTKLELIESSLYSILFIPTILVIAFILSGFWKLTC
ncbi:hypothetical protein ES705_24797 [subsurface metagenome]